MSKCELCGGAKYLCPGCTGGKIPAELFFSCGVLIRCPWCIGYQEALDDVAYEQEHLDCICNECTSRYDDRMEQLISNN